MFYARLLKQSLFVYDQCINALRGGQAVRHGEKHVDKLGYPSRTTPISLVDKLGYSLEDKLGISRASFWYPSRISNSPCGEKPDYPIDDTFGRSRVFIL